MGFKNWWNRNVVGTEDVTVDGPIAVGDDSFHDGSYGRGAESVEEVSEQQKDHYSEAFDYPDYSENPPTRDDLAGPIDLYPNQIGGAVVTVNGRTVFNSEKRKRKADVTIQFDPDKGLVTLDITELTD
ncbi:hypothetical protein SEA_ZIKO_24 [Gordonia phage Ziko]|uniref:Uncharacterized protein n=1 Tax=Gordonia phage Ziko TaxID=2591193 RepID=A0A514A539_9CAUD|nr:hypothetical protein SEA_ZIKO_24 [Gordonia phage Ziko]